MCGFLGCGDEIVLPDKVAAALKNPLPPPCLSP